MDQLDLHEPVGASDLPPYSETIPLRGLSGVLRRRAHRMQDWQPSRWFLLMLADRVDVVESSWRLFALGGAALALLGGLLWRRRWAG